jgi:periplasmic divalent cation tolerance protein
MTNAQYAVLVTTAANQDDAKIIAKALLEQKLAACVQLTPITSLYTWEGKMSEDAEILILVKTRAAITDKAMAAILAVHKYKVPEIIQLPIEKGHGAYLSWIDEVTT